MPMAYFRNVDQSNLQIQNQMLSYVDEIVTNVDSIIDYPNYFWLNDFNKFRTNQLLTKFLNVSSNVEHIKSERKPHGYTTPTFNEQLDEFMNDPYYSSLYGEDIVRDEITGDIITSRVQLFMDNMDRENVNDAVKALNQQREISAKQSINKDSNDWSFFTYDYNYSGWEFFAVAVSELAFTTIMGVIAVSTIALALIPHWTAVFFVFSFISILYVNLLGVLQILGVHINAVSYVALVMSIGLMVDFIMHVLLRYYECDKVKNDNATPTSIRRDRVVETLQTIGVSVLLGGISTFLGVLPLAATTSNIINTIFKGFIALVTLGISHGLVLLPVLLSYIGPVN